jgi:rhodanese-related sulfurtransferase
MATYRELLKEVKERIVEIDAREAQDLEGAAWIDVREQDEWDEGHLPGAVHIPRGNLESRIENVVTDKTTPVVLYCASASRSAFAAESLLALGFERRCRSPAAIRTEAQRARDRHPQAARRRSVRATAAPPDPRDR